VRQERFIVESYFGGSAWFDEELARGVRKGTGTGIRSIRPCADGKRHLLSGNGMCEADQVLLLWEIFSHILAGKQRYDSIIVWWNG
jgi:hypothetical protein